MSKDLLIFPIVHYLHTEPKSTFYLINSGCDHGHMTIISDNICDICDYGFTFVTFNKVFLSELYFQPWLKMVTFS